MVPIEQFDLSTGLSMREAGAANLVLSLGLTAAAILSGWLSGRFLGPVLAEWWSHRSGERHAGMQRRVCALARQLVMTLILVVALQAADWTFLASLVLGLAGAVSVALLTWYFARGLRLSRLAAGLIAGAAAAAIFSDAVEGVRSLGSVLERIGLSIAGRHVTLLDAAQVAIGLLVLLAVVRLGGRVANHSIARTGRLDPTQKLLAKKLASLALLAAAFFVGIDLVGIDLTALAVFSGAVGLAVGFGLQKTFGNLIAGIILLMDRSIKPGDIISVGDSFGAINKIGVRAVSIVTRDGKEHLIPNENLMTEEVVNWSYSNTDVRVHIPVGVAYDCDLRIAQKLMIEAAKRPARVLDRPPPVVWLKEFGKSSVDHEILVWIRDPEEGVGNVQSEVLNAVWDLFKENGIGIPFPQRDIHVRSLPAKREG